MKVALVHDYLNEFGGAERVLLALSELWPEAPIFTAFCTAGSFAAKRFEGKNIRTSWFNLLPFASKLASPLRFLAPAIWNSFNRVKLGFDFSEYDVVISSANWFITKGFQKGSKTIEVCYCHTPPRYLYGYSTSVEWKRFWLVCVYGKIVSHFLRMYDYRAAQKVDYFVANSKEVQRRIQKFYRRNSKVIYPPVDIRVKPFSYVQGKRLASSFELGNYYLVVSRLVGGKGLELAVEAANSLGFSLKVVGKSAGWGAAGKRLRQIAGKTVEFLGDVGDEELWTLYAGAKAFLATAKDEDFGITPVEAMACGTPVIAYRGGGYTETVIEGKTGIYFDEYSVEGLVDSIKKFEARSTKFEIEKIREHAEKFSKERFAKEMMDFVTTHWEDSRKNRLKL